MIKVDPESERNLEKYDTVFVVLPNMNLMKNESSKLKIFLKSSHSCDDYCIPLEISIYYTCQTIVIDVVCC